MCEQKRKNDLPPKLCIGLLTPDEKRNEINKSNTLVHTLENQDLDLKYYACLYATIHCQTHNHPLTNIINYPLVVTIHTQHHV